MKASQSQIAENVSMFADVDKTIAKKVIAIYCEQIVENLKTVDAVATPMGTFKRVGRKARNCRNPHTGAKIKIPARIGIIFKPNPSFKSDLN